jgi:hypothetical protein
MFMALDSLGGLSTDKELSDIGEGKDTRDMTRAQLIKGAFRVLSLKLGYATVPLLMTNHVYAEVGAYFPQKIMGGGSGLQYAASTIVFLSKSKKRDGATNEVTGAIITAKNPKSRFTRENKEVEILLDYQLGLDRYYGLIDIAVTAGLVHNVSKKLVFPNGKTAFENAVNKQPERYFDKELLDKIELACKDQFCYGAPVRSADVAGEDDEPASPELLQESK